jgi:hypothetical protein
LLLLQVEMIVAVGRFAEARAKSAVAGTELKGKIKVLTLHYFNWFLMTPSIGTKFQYVNSPFIFTHYMFRPLQAIFR